MTRTPGHDDDRYPLAPPADTPTLEADAAGAPQGALGRVRTFESFKHRDFTLFFSGALLSNVGSWMQMTALGWLVYNLTGKSSAFGTVNFLSGAPVFFLIIFTGALADHVDRRKLLIATQIVLMAQAAAFGALASLGHVTIAWVYGLSLLGGIASAFMAPAWQAMTPDLVPKKTLMNAIALNAAQFNAARLIGPMAAAAVIAIFGRNQSDGITEVFYVNAASFLFVIWALVIIRPKQHGATKGPREKPVQMLLAGLKYAAEHRRVRMHLLTMVFISVFGMPFSTLLPAIAVQTLHVSSTGYSVLMAANGLGALAGALGVASLSGTVRREAIVRFGITVLALGGFALSVSRSTLLTAAILTVMGAAFLACVSSVNTNLQTAVPPELRARVMSLFVLAFMGMMPFGALLFGWLGDLIGPSYAVTAGAVVLLAYSLVLLARPSLLCEAGEERC
ncbi:MAG: MFS transporter [Actinomycetota bacterium]|nr:MAG: major facilitator superfamily [Actinomycetota bacterium]MDO8949092.1 MFS transporter [Actinomycetota bacterium]MDP3631458.1 MFS transporter [Actinomycetota bacterium]